jgi:glycosyltransferase involved in cell wall biosynthesis
LKAQAVSWVVANGLWELAFPAFISPGLLEWCKTFNPDIIYSTCTDISYISLTLQLKRLLQVPLCLQVDDDWMGCRYRRGVGRLTARPVLERKVQSLLAGADLRISNGPLMTRVFLERYAVHFEPVYLADDIRRFDEVGGGGVGSPERPVIVYCGSLILGRWQGILDLDDALGTLGEWGEHVTIHVHTHHVPMEAADAFKCRPRIRVLPGPSDAEVPGILCRADLLILPESFLSSVRDYIHLSISSKAHLYMMSGRPSLVYGPAGVGVVEYARSERWAKVVDRPDREALASAVRNLLKDPMEAQAQVTQARGVALRNHQIQQVRESFRSMLVGLWKR